MKIFKKIISLFLLIPAFSILSKGAGVLPFSHDKKHNTYFYFTREARGKDKGTFADCGGKFELKDKRFRHVAAREFSEESMQIFKTRDDKRLNRKNALDFINKNKPLNSYYKNYAMYYIRVKNLDSYFSDFAKKRIQLLNLLKKNPKHKFLIASTEKDILVSVTKKDLIKSIITGNPFVKVFSTSNSSKVSKGSFIRIRPYVFRSLQNAYVRGILQKL